jgi:hypothetical protein
MRSGGDANGYSHHRDTSTTFAGNRAAQTTTRTSNTMFEWSGLTLAYP